MFSVVKDIHAVLTPATSRVLTTGTVPADAAEVVVSYPALAPSAAIFLDAVLHTQELEKTFTHPVSKGSTAKCFLNLQQGNRSVAEFVIEFSTVAAETGWPE